MNTPFDNPKKLLDRLLFPTFREIYLEGYNDAKALSTPARKLGGSWPPPPNRDEDDFERVTRWGA